MTDQQKQARQLIVVLTIVFFGFVGISMPYLIFPALFLNPTYSILPADTNASSQALLLGITLASYPLGQFIGSPILGALSDDYGRKRLLAASLLVTAACNLLTGVAIAWHHLPTLIASRFAAGLMEGNIAIARAMASDMKLISKHKTFGKINAAASIAYVLGPLLGGLLSDGGIADGLTPSTPFYCTALLFVGLSALAAWMITTDTSRTRLHTRSIFERFRIFSRTRMLFVNKHLQFFMIVYAVFSLATDIFFEFGPVYLTSKWLFGPLELTVYNGLLSLALAAGSGWLPAFVSSRFSSRLAISLSCVGMILCLVGIVITDSKPLMLLYFALIGVVIGLNATLLTVKISDSAAEEIQGEVMGVQIALRVLGNAAICILGGVLLLLSSKAILVFAALLVVATLIYYRRR